MYNLSFLARTKILIGDKITGYPALDRESRLETIRYILDVLNCREFQVNPSMYINAYIADRGPVKKYILPQDIAICVIRSNLSAITATA